MNSDFIKAKVASHFRYELGTPIVAFEADYHYYDIFIVDKKLLTIDVEVKVTITDLKNDKRKPKHSYMSTGEVKTTNKFYFAIPSQLYEKARIIVDADYPYAGIITVEQNGKVDFKKTPRVFITPKLKLVNLRSAVLKMSSSLCALQNDLILQTELLNQLNKENRKRINDKHRRLKKKFYGQYKLPEEEEISWKVKE